MEPGWSVELNPLSGQILRPCYTPFHVIGFALGLRRK
jgi:hypothetical protein